MSKIVYPEHYDDEDKSNYDALIAQGQALIGKKLPKCDEFLLDLSAKMTINKIKGYKNDLTLEEITEQMKTHKQSLKEVELTTPEGLYEEGQHPLELNPCYDNTPKELHPTDLDIIQ